MKNIDIFYADDDIDDLEIFTDAIEKINREFRSNIILHTFPDGPALLKQLRTTYPDNCIILLDINMPVRTGLEILKDLRKDEWSKSLPVVMYSTSSETRIIRLCREAGANLYAVKPNDFNTLITIVNRMTDLALSGWPADPKQFVLSARYI